MRKKKSSKRKLLKRMPEVKIRKPTAPGMIVFPTKKDYKRSRDKKRIEREYEIE